MTDTMQVSLQILSRYILSFCHWSLSWRARAVPAGVGLLLPGLISGLGVAGWAQSAGTLERPVLSNRALLGRADTAAPSPAVSGTVSGGAAGAGRSRSVRPDFRFTPRNFTPRTVPPTDVPVAAVSGAPPSTSTVSSPPAPSAWVRTGEGTPYNPFRLKPLPPPPALSPVVSSPVPALLRHSERQYWQSRAVLVAHQEQVPPWLFLRLIRQESGFNPRARSPVGAIGLTQLMPDTARSLGVNPHDPEQNLRGGARYLRQMLHRFRGHIPSALASYNAGPIAVEAYQRGETRRVGNKIINAGRRVLPIPPYRETRNYVASILGGIPGVPAIRSLPAPSLPPPPVAEPPPPTLRRTGRIYLAGGNPDTSSSGSGSGPGEASETGTETTGGEPGTGGAISPRRSLRPSFAGNLKENDKENDPENPPPGQPSVRGALLRGSLSGGSSAAGGSDLPPNTPAGAEIPSATDSHLPNLPKSPGMVRSLPNRSIYIIQSGGRP